MSLVNSSMVIDMSPAQLPFIPIARPMLGDAERTSVLAVLTSGQLAQGAVVDEFETAFAAACGVRYAVAVTNGTLALHTALVAYGIGEGDEVITSPFSFIASANAIRAAGAIPIFADISPETFTLDPSAVRAAITPRTAAILPVHLFGHPAEMPALVAIAQTHGLAIVEDACQAHGAKIGDVSVGGYGAGCFSFYPTKNITSGEGGMITTNDPAVADAARLFRNHGMRRRYFHESFGMNYRMTDLHAAVGIAQLPHLAEWNARRQQNAIFLSHGLHESALVLPSTLPTYTHVFHQYTVRIHKGRDVMREKLRAEQIGTEVYYPVPIHLQSVYANAFQAGQFPEAERAACEVLSLPVHPSLTEQELERIVRSTWNVLES